MKKIIILICVVLVIFITAYFINHNNQKEIKKEQNFSIKFSGNFSPEELEKIMSGNLNIKELKNIIGEENIEINK